MGGARHGPLARRGAAARVSGRTGDSSNRGGEMKHHKRILAAAGAAAVGALVAAALVVVPAKGTPASGVSIAPLAPIAIFNEINDNAKTGDWKAKIETHGLSALHINQVTIQPG